MMKSRERVRMALNHKEADRVPIDFGSTCVTGITRGAYEKLIDYFQIKKVSIEIIDYVQQLVNIDQRIQEIFKVDAVRFTANPPSYWSFQPYDDGDNFYFQDEWGILWRMPKHFPRYFELYKCPLKGLALSEIKNYRWPDPLDKARFFGLRSKINKIIDSTDKAVVASHPSGAGVLEQACWMTGMEEFFTQMILEKKKAMHILNVITDIYCEMWSRYLEEVGDYVDVCVFSEDLGIQNSPLISYEMYLEMLEPLLRKYITSVRKKTDAKIFFHSCGDIYQFIPSLINIGIDILNPVQVSAKEMGDTKRLKEEFGRDLVFWGASCDPQQILPFGTKEQVIDEVKRRIDNLAPQGGFVFAPVHNIQSGVPPENITALFESALNYGQYSLLNDASY